MAFTVTFEDNGEIISATNAGGQAALAQSGTISGQLGHHRVREINSVAILTTENPHIVIYQAGKLIILPH